MRRIACIGECMIELSEAGDGGRGLMRRTFGGDTLNTAVYAARALRGSDVDVHYVTALGDDPFSDEMIAAWEEEGVGTDLVARVPGALPGLYMIRTDAGGERRFFYWRSAAAARRLFHTARTGEVLAKLCDFDLVYLSGITLAVLAPEDRERLCALLAEIRGNGGGVAFDSNYRPRLWPEVDAARAAIAAVLPHVTLALPTFGDEQQLHGDADPSSTANRLHAAGVPEVAVKNGTEPCLVSIGAKRHWVPPERVVPVDTTAAGDAFNGGYIAARLLGAEPTEAARRGAVLAARVVGHRGAIVPE